MPSTPQTVTLSIGEHAGEQVTFKTFFNHRADFEFYRSIREGMARAEASGLVKESKGIPTFVYLEACEAALPLVIERIVRNGEEIPFSKPWLDGLHPKDYQLLSDALVTLRDELNAEAEAGKKKD